MTRTVIVYLDAGAPRKVGYLHLDLAGGKESCSFFYDQGYLASGDSGFVVDPSLFFDMGRQSVPQGKKLFGAIMDSCPDRWGRFLMKEKESLLAEKEDRRPRYLSELDYLLGVSDYFRSGALRFKETEDGPFLEEGKDVPPLEYLGKLEDVAVALEEKKPVEDKAMERLLRSGSSLGGARPKCSVEGRDGALWIAKFPSAKDDYDVSSFEMVAHDLAALCGISVPEASLGEYSPYGKTYLSKRFDRDGEKRIPYSSAMALLGKNDGEEASYLDLVGFIQERSVDPKEDLKELYRRMLFSLVIANTDDHLRNHGFLYVGKGYRLSPAFDINPNNEKQGMDLSLDGYSHERNLDLALNLAPYFYVKKVEAEQMRDQIQTVVKNNYRILTKKYGIPDKDASRMEKAFLL